jgi:hypothetical protein
MEQATTLTDVTHAKSFDPSAAWRARMTERTANASASATSRVDPPMNNNSYAPYSTTTMDEPSPVVSNTGVPHRVANRIPQFFYPRYNDRTHGNVGHFPVQQQTTMNGVHRPATIVEQTAAELTPAYAAPIAPVFNEQTRDANNAYAVNYPGPTVVNAPAELVPPMFVPTPVLTQEQAQADALAVHKQNSDLSHVEVYHFTPKQNSHMSPADVAHSARPPVQYHPYPYAMPTAAAPVMSSVPPSVQQQYPQPTYSYPWHGYPPNGFAYGFEPSFAYIQPAETEARGMQTDGPVTKNRAVSPIEFLDMSQYGGLPHARARPQSDSRLYSHQGAAFINRPDPSLVYNEPHYRQPMSSSMVPDCRCLDCQYERGKLLNYYHD